MGALIQMAGTSTGGTESAISSIDVPMTGHIIGVTWNMRCDFDTDNDFSHWQLSFGSTITVANDSRQVISNCQMGLLTFTAGGSVVGVANYHMPCPDIPIGMGERLFLHSNAAAGVVSAAFALLHFDFNMDQVAVRRR